MDGHHVNISVDATILLFAVGSNPVQKSGGVTKIFASGKSIVSGTLTVYDATGNIVRKVNIKDNKDIMGGNAVRRVVGEWDLRDARGRPVPTGTYLARGAITVNGKRERVSVVVGVR